MNIAANVAVKHKKPVAIFSLEMSRDELFLRFLCSEARVSSKKVRTGYLGKRDWGVLTGAASRLSEAPIYIDDSPSLSVIEMKARARRLQTEKGLDLESTTEKRRNVVHTKVITIGDQDPDYFEFKNIG